MENKINPIEGQLTIIDAEGNERLCQILFTLESQEFGKKYVIFYPIEQLESEDISLRDSIGLYSNGAKIIARCKDELSGIEKEIIIIGEELQKENE